MSTSISWTEETWNPVTGCSRVSAGCEHCYAERLSLKYGWTHKPWSHQNAAENVRCHYDRLTKPEGWTKPRMVFVNSMSDLFHEEVPDIFIYRVLEIIRACPRHTFQILTKRPARVIDWEWPRNVWLGVSVENEKAKHRLEMLRDVDVPIRFVSFEPLIGPVGVVDLTGYHWAIVGGESGPDFRPMDMTWARDLRDQCVAQHVAFFFKQDASKTPGTRPYLIEEDGTQTEYKQYPGDYPSKPQPKPEPVKPVMAEQLSLL